MVGIIRLDERLIHGQVATGWIKGGAFDTLLVIDDESAKDNFLCKTLYMAAPAEIRTFVMTTEEALNVLCDPRCKTRQIFAVVRTPKTLLDICSKAPDVQEIHISNFGRMVPSPTERTRYTGHFYLNEEEKAEMEKVMALGIPVYNQMAATSPKTPFELKPRD